MLRPCWVIHSDRQLSFIIRFEYFQEQDELSDGLIHASKDSDYFVPREVAGKTAGVRPQSTFPSSITTTTRPSGWSGEPRPQTTAKLKPSFASAASLKDLSTGSLVKRIKLSALSQAREASSSSNVESSPSEVWSRLKLNWYWSKLFEKVRVEWCEDNL